MNKKISIKAIWHPYWKWEEVVYNMWGTVTDHDGFLKRAIKFTGNHKLYGKYMRIVVRKWRYSCEHNLSKIGTNRRAWVGHAAVALALQCPEDIVREAWWHLSDRQREFANKQADKAIKLWETNYVKETNKRKRVRSRAKKNRMDI